MIVAEELSKRFDERSALDSVSFRVARDEVVGFLGPNGAGKTTAMRILAGVFPPTTGRALLAGLDVGTHPIEARQRLGYAPERPALYLEMRVMALLRFIATLRGVGAVPAAVDDVIDRLRLAELAARRVGTLSKGMRQRVGMAVALVGDPPVLLLDEPTAGLDPGERTETRRLIRSLAPGKAILVSSHELPDVEAFCDRVIILHRGRVLAEGPPESLGARIRSRPTVRVEAVAPREALRAALAALPGVARVTVEDERDDAVCCAVEPATDDDLRPVVAARIHERSWRLLALGRDEPSLEETFLRLVEREPS